MIYSGLLVGSGGCEEETVFSADVCRLAPIGPGVEAPIGPSVNGPYWPRCESIAGKNSRDWRKSNRQFNRQFNCYTMVLHFLLHLRNCFCRHLKTNAAELIAIYDDPTNLWHRKQWF